MGMENAKQQDVWNVVKRRKMTWIKSNNVASRTETRNVTLCRGHQSLSQEVPGSLHHKNKIKWCNMK